MYIDATIECTMSKCETIRGKCPTCFLEQDITIWGSVNTSLNPELKPKVLSQDILRLKCSACNGILMLGYPLLYNDMAKQLMIWLKPGQQDQMPSPPPFMGDYRLRVVRSPNGLVEKILVFDADLDDRVIEVVKLGVCRELISSYGGALEKLHALPFDASGLLFVFRSSTKNDDKLWFLLLLQEQPQLPCLVAVDFAQYSVALARLGKMPEGGVEPGRWHTLDFEWAHRTVSADDVPLKIEMIVSPDLLMAHPVAASLWQKHVELMSKVAGPAERHEHEEIDGHINTVKSPLILVFFLAAAICFVAWVASRAEQVSPSPVWIWASGLGCLLFLGLSIWKSLAAK